jgi:tetratricopeptide (TPR) repeat protein/TolB-like protein
MGIVYRAQDTRLARDVALKFLPGEWSHDSLLRERFSREARAASALDHPNICTIYEIDETDDGHLFIAMAYCPGQTLKECIAEGPIPVDQAVAYAIQIAEGLERAHAANIVHRDIKPANILLSERDQVKIVDFGLAKLAGEAAVTREGSVIGTPAYMSPEQVNGETVDGRSDIWALGTVLYEMLTGRRAFAADHEQAVMMAILGQDPTPIDSVRTDVPGELARIVRRCLKRDPAERYQTAGELVADLRRFRGDISPAEIVTQSLPSAPRIRRRWLVRHRLLPGVAAVALVILVATIYPTLSRPRLQHMLVLPFTCQAADPQTSDLCAGLLEVVTNKLTALRGYRANLSVVPSSEVRRQHISSAEEARRTFGVDLVITGGVQRDGSNYRVSLQLVDADLRRQLRSRLITTEGAVGFAIQDRVVEVVEEMLELELSPRERRVMTAGGTNNAEAARWYLEARGTVGPNPTPNELGQAADLFRAALDVDPDYADAMVGLAEVCRRRYESEDDPIWLEHGLSYANRALDVDPTLPLAHLAAGRCELAQHDYGAAAGHFERTLELDPLNLDAAMQLAAAFEDSGKAERAQEVYERAVRTGPDDWQTHHFIGKFLLEKRFQPARAVDHFRRVVELLPDSSIGYADLGACLFYLDDRSGARTNLEKAVAIGPSYWALHNLATLEYYDGNFAAAAERYRQALAIDDSDYDVWSALAEASRAADAPPPQVRQAYARAAELAAEKLRQQPEDISALVSLASFRIHLGQDAAARELLQRAKELGTDNAEEMYFIAESAERLGDRELALEWIGRALRAGYPLQVIEDYPDLAELREDPRFRDAVERAVGPTANRVADGEER